MTHTEPAPLSHRALGKVIDRVMRLPAPTSDHVVTRDLPIPMRDGVTLLADLHEPTGAVKGTVLVRSPYGWPTATAAFMGGVFARRGYRVVLARCRGTFGSGGAFEPMRHEVDDGADTVAWMREQPWFDGRFATYGPSYHRPGHLPPHVADPHLTKSAMCVGQPQLERLTDTDCGFR